MAEIFMSYRRADAAATAGALFERLTQHFGAKQVFRDIDSIEAGENFEQAIRDAIRAASAVLVVIGPHWLELRGDDGRRRLDDEDDYVRREIELALASDTAVVPVLIENALLPPAELLPPTIRELDKRHALVLSPSRWQADLDNLIRRLETSGIPILEGATGAERPPVPLYKVVAGALSGFIPDLFTLLRRPRRFLARAAQGRPAELTRAFVFFTLSVALAVTILVSGYTPAESVVFFALAVLMLGLMGTLSLSAPLWLVWRLVGAKRHYARLLIVMLYQIAVLHLLGLLATWVVLIALDLKSQNIMRETIGAATRPGISASDGLEIIRGRIVPLVDATEVRIALVLAALLLIGSVAWIAWSWRAYRDAFGLTRARSLAAVAGCAVLAWAVVALIA